MVNFKIHGAISDQIIFMKRVFLRYSNVTPILIVPCYLFFPSVQSLSVADLDLKNEHLPGCISPVYFILFFVCGKVCSFITFYLLLTSF